MPDTGFGSDSRHKRTTRWRSSSGYFAWVVPHTFRTTVATLIKEETTTKNAAAQLGHSSEDVTATY